MIRSRSLNKSHAKYCQEILTMANASDASVLPSNGSRKSKRKSFAREFMVTVCC